MVLPARFLLCAARVVTCSDSLCTSNNPLGTIEAGAVLIADGRVVAVGARNRILTEAPDAPIVLDTDGVLTPGLVDAHTHLAWTGSRHDEYVLRMQGAGYEAIAAAGGGIVSSMRSVREASPDELEERLRRRLRRMASLGTTTCEVKSGYGLSLESELRQLEAVANVSKDPGLPRTVPTYLALHALPPEGREDRAGWVDQVVGEWVGEIARAKLARFVDAYIDRNAFTVQEGERLFRAADAAGLGIRAHVGQFADVGGADLAARVKAYSVDHMEHVSDEALRSLAVAGTLAVLLPVASFTLRQAPPRVQAMRDAGVGIVVASDANPGTAPTESLTLALAFGLHTYGLTPQECLLGATRRAAASLGLESECGHLSPGTSADVVVWDLPHEHAILQPWASPMTRLVLRGGHVLFSGEP